MTVPNLKRTVHDLLCFEHWQQREKRYLQRHVRLQRLTWQQLRHVQRLLPLL